MASIYEQTVLDLVYIHDDARLGSGDWRCRPCWRQVYCGRRTDPVGDTQGVLRDIAHRAGSISGRCRVNRSDTTDARTAFNTYWDDEPRRPGDLLTTLSY
jgi:hypothetical protein